MKKNILLHSLLLCTCLGSCVPDRAWLIRIENKSDEPIGYWVNHTDTTFPPPGTFIDRIEPHKTQGEESRERWERVIAATPHQRIALYVFKWDSANTRLMDSLRPQLTLLRKMDITAEDMRRTGAELSYP